jgi:ribonuclease P protein component
MKEHGLPRRLRVRRQADFDSVYQRNVYAADATLVVRGCENGLSDARLGISVSRQAGTAVVRNRWKRIIREVFRLNRDKIPSGIDLVVRPRRGAAPDFHEVETSLPKLCQRISARLKRQA